MVEGTVTITLKDFQDLLDAQVKAVDLREKTRLASRELQVFLSFLCTRADIEKHVEEFNRQSQTAKIVFEGTSAKIEIKNDTETTTKI